MLGTHILCDELSKLSKERHVLSGLVLHQWRRKAIVDVIKWRMGSFAEATMDVGVEDKPCKYVLLRADPGAVDKSSADKVTLTRKLDSIS